MITRVRVAPETVTVLGSRVKPHDPMWLGLDLANAEPRAQATIMLAIIGEDAPEDIHLRVPWNHPEDTANGIESGCFYRVRPRMQVGKRWKGKIVKSLSFERWNGEWFIALGFNSRNKTPRAAPA